MRKQYLRGLMSGLVVGLAGCSTPTTPPAPVPEVIRSDAFYAKSEREAREMKRIWNARYPNNRLVLVGSKDERDYTSMEVIKSVPPVYPPELAARGIQGDVVVEGTLDSLGRVIEVYVVRSSDVRFEDAARAALAQWTFKPRRYKGVPIMSTVSLPLEFRLN